MSNDFRDGTISIAESIEIARRFAKEYTEDYYEEPFHPHIWVIMAICHASGEWYDRAVDERIKRANLEIEIRQIIKELTDDGTFK